MKEVPEFPCIDPAIKYIIEQLSKIEDTQKSMAESYVGILLQANEGAILEKLATLEHEQWAHWTRYMLENLTPENIRRWKFQIKTPYSNLTEFEKESDREWARKAFKICCSEINDEVKL